MEQSVPPELQVRQLSGQAREKARKKARRMRKNRGLFILEFKEKKTLEL